MLYDWIYEYMKVLLFVEEIVHVFENIKRTMIQLVL